MVSRRNRPSVTAIPKRCDDPTEKALSSMLGTTSSRGHAAAPPGRQLRGDAVELREVAGLVRPRAVNAHDSPRSDTRSDDDNSGGGQKGDDGRAVAELRPQNERQQRREAGEQHSGLSDDRQGSAALKRPTSSLSASMVMLAIRA